MIIYNTDLNKMVIQHTLKTLGICSKAIENLLLGTAAAQARLAPPLKNSNGIGAYGIDKETHCSIWDDYLAFDSDLASTIRGLASQHEFLKNPHIELATNLAYATAIAWMIYKRNDVILPHPDNIEGLAQCWAECFVKNSDTKKAKLTFIDAYLESTSNSSPNIAA